MKNTKAQLETHHLILIIILIVSFGILIFFFVKSDLFKNTDEDICHDSVVKKSIGQGLVGDLDCKTSYVCISGGGECEGITPSITVEVNPNDKYDIMDAIAEEMANCWWMFGEGEMDYLRIGESGLSSITCAICSIIEFDEQILDRNYQTNYREFYEHLNEIEKGKISYFEYLYGVDDIDMFQNQISDLQINIDQALIFTNAEHYIVTGIKDGLFKKESFIPPYYVNSYQISSELECKTFITKA